MYTGLKQGGISGYGNAAVGALRTGAGAASLAGDSALAGELGSAAGAVAVPLSLYNAVKNWQSGNTGSDALNGAEAGAAVGSYVLPGVGTVVGGVIGGVVGGISAAFGGGEKDPETTNFNSIVSQNAKAGGNQIIQQLNPGQAYQSLAGMMDAKNNTAGHSTQLEMAFGREGEGALMSQMTQQINSAIQSKKVPADASAAQLYKSVVMPWLKSKNAYMPSNAVISSNGTKNNGTVDTLLTQLIGHWQSGALTGNSQVGVAGQTISGLSSYGGQYNGPAASPYGVAAHYIGGGGVVRGRERA